MFFGFKLEILYYYITHSEEGYTINEAELVNFCADADPINFSGIDDNVTGEIISIRTEDSDEEIYYS